jgi:hypothetical protein
MPRPLVFLPIVAADGITGFRVDLRMGKCHGQVRHRP